MDHFELVEKLRERANVSYEDAKRALEASNWDLLDAMVLLENEGRIQSEENPAFTTRREPRPQHVYTDDSARGILRRLVDVLVSLINRASKIDVVVSRYGKTVMALPLIAVILLVLFAPWMTIPVMLIALFFGFRYAFRGEGISDKVNQAMDRVADAADSIRSGKKNDQNV
ncbi:MAG TPA: hypothetical protein GX722_02700 [Clostridiales bacterium]|jgi:hypothetical protein|nr:hypothetical protein [Clostridiales bacterium]